MPRSTHIGTLTEHSLHADIKTWLAQPGDAFEQQVDGYQIDIVRGDLLIEIQTANFSALKIKLNRLLESHKILLVHPIPVTKWIIRQTKRGRQVAKRKSPKRGRVEHLFDELLYISQLIPHPNLSLMALLTLQEEIWRDDGRGSWTRGHWSIADRRLLDVVESSTFANPSEYLRLIPAGLEPPFTHAQLAKAIKAPVWMSTRMSYCLRKMGALESVGKQGHSLLLAPNAALIQSSSL
jgi:hypothetical protein